MTDRETASAGLALRVAFSAFTACALGIFLFAAARGLYAATVLSVVVAAIGATAAGWALWRRASVLIQNEAAPRGLKLLSAVAAVAALVQLARVCIFIVNPALTAYAFTPARGLGLPPEHSCFSAYFVAAHAAPSAPNIYADELYSQPAVSKTAPRKPLRLASFNVDAYEYPPPFLLLPRALFLAAPDFLHLRMLWFALNGAVLLAGLLAVAPRLGPVAGTRALLLAPLVLAADPVVGTLQTGNLQAIVATLAMVAMVLFGRRRYAAGGALLAFATVSKLFPGVLLVYLLVRRRWHALAWTGGFIVALVALSLLDTGWTPYHAFLAHLPRLLSGESFPAFRNPAAVAKNFSVPGMAFKLSLFGVPGASFAAMRLVGWLYTPVLLALTVLLARRRAAREDRPLIWLAILIVASLRSPFLPGYAVIPVLWLLTLLAAKAVPTARGLALTVAAWLVLSFSQLSTGRDPRWIAALTLLPQAVMVLLLVRASRAGTREVVAAPTPMAAAMARS